MLAHDSIEGAAKEFEGLFSDILEKHAPIKTFQMRKNYLPQISSETKLLMAERRALQEEATATGNPLLLKEFKTKDKEVKKAAKEDKKEHHEINFSDEATVQTAWKTARISHLLLFKMKKKWCPTLPNLQTFSIPFLSRKLGCSGKRLLQFL